VWDLASGKAVRILEGRTSWVLSLAVSPDGRHIVGGRRDGVVRVWDLASGEAVGTLKGHTDWVRSVAVTPDGRHIISGGDDRTVRVWDLASGEAVRTFEGRTNSVLSVAVTPDGRHVVAGGGDRMIRVWDLGTGSGLAELVLLTDGWACWLPGGRYKLHGDVNGAWWFVSGLVRFEHDELPNELMGIQQISDREPILRPDS
jgi:WD40 repeat protein